MKSCLIILTLNEIEAVTALFDKIPMDATDACLVIDGGSTDGTIEFFKERQIPVVIQDKRGRGEAFRLAFRKSDADFLIFYSPDGNENPEDIVKLNEKMKQGFDMVIASRFLPEGANEEDDLLFPWRKWANQAFTLCANILWRGKLTDSINGYRAIRKDAFKRLNPDGPGFVIEYQLSIRAMKLKLKLAELPTCEGQRIGGESGAKSIPTGLLFIRFLLRELFLGNSFDNEEK